MQRVVITGANRGIGLGFVRVYLERGHRVFACCRDPGLAAALDEVARQNPDQCAVVNLDVRSRSQIDAAVEQVRRRTDAVDVVINNAGVFFPSTRLAEIGADQLAESMAVNAIAPMIVGRAFLQLLEAGVRPRLVNITAPTRPLTALSATENHSYLASRYALNALTRMVAGELASQGIVTVALWPGYLRTDMNGMADEATPPEEALPGVVDVIDRLEISAAGTCLLPDGTTHPW
ncbi:MAG: SDR family NAD(P)-dependent oxidoreductase [Acidimicrobiales bacterium]